MRSVTKHSPHELNWKDGMLPTLDAEQEQSVRTHVPYRIILFVLAILLAIVVIVGRLVQLQIITSAQYSVLADTNRITEEFVPYERGLIIDANGEVLARNIPTYEAIVRLNRVNDDQITTEWYSQVASLFSIEPIELETKIDQARIKGDQEVVIKNNLDQEFFITYISKINTVAGVEIQPTMKRFYPNGPNTAHIVGYLSEVNSDERAKKEFSDYLNGEEVGRSGIESAYQTILRGVPGIYEYRSQGNSDENTVSVLRDSVPGRSVSVSISTELQNKSVDLLRAYLEKHESPSGVILVQNIHTGDIVIMATLPSYDNNIFTDGLSNDEFKLLFEDPSWPLYNRAIAGEYPPGSLVKPIVGAAALQEELITARTILTDTPQVIEIGGGRFADWRVSWGRGPYGQMTVKEAIAQSSNIFYYKISGGYEEQQGLGIRRMADYFNAFNIGKRTGVDLPGESEGLVPTPAWKLANKNENWYLGDDYQVGIGQGDLLVTPVQMVNAVSAIANGGVLYQPRLVNALYDYNDMLIEQLPPKIVRELPLTDGHIKTIQEGMRLAVSEGIVFPLRNTNVQVAGKTGTAEFGIRDDEGIFKTHAWVEGYFPYDAPLYSIVVLLENGGSSQFAAELGAEVINMMYPK